MLIVGIDLAWGEAKSDGVCFIRRRREAAWVEGYAYPQGDDALVAAIVEIMPQANPTFLAIDAPIVCPNPTGSRPVDRAITSMFWREHAGCHPANATRCPRPARVLAALARLGFVAGTDLRAASRLASEVYPHPAMVRLFGLPRILGYKRKPRRPLAHCAAEFARFQRLTADLVSRAFPALELDDATRALLRAPLTKKNEDLLDAFFCALIGLWHVQHRGRRSEIVGDLETGFVLLPVAEAAPPA